MDGRPSLEKRVLARAKGERRGPRRLSLALAVALLMLLLAAAALAAGVLTGWLRLRQEDVGALHGCVSLDGTLYLSTSGGLRTWKPGQEESTLLVSMDELQAQGIGFDTLIYADGDAPALLDRSGKKLWRWQDGALVCTLDYAGTPMDLPQERYQAAVMQDGWLFLRAVPPEGTVYEADVYRADPLTGDAERLPLEGVTELCAWEGGLLAVACDVDSDVCPPCVGGPGERDGPYAGRAVHAGDRGRGLRREHDLRHRGRHAVPVERHGLDGAAGLRARPSGLRLCGGGRGLRVPWHERHAVRSLYGGGQPATLTIRRLHQRRQHRRGFPAGLSRRGRIARRRPLAHGAAGGRGHRRRRRNRPVPRAHGRGTARADAARAGLRR